MTGTFITFEGIDGCGKSTQAVMLAETLRAAGHEVVEVREPGTTALAERVRQILLDPVLDSVDPMAELMLYVACRAQLVGEIVRPSLARGAVVVSDRYGDSSVAYQGYGRNLGADVVRQANRVGTGGLLPDLTILVDVPVPLAHERRSGQSADRIEREKAEFHERVRSGYLEIARLEPERVAVIDGSGTPDGVRAAVITQVRERLPDLTA